MPDADGRPKTLIPFYSLRLGHLIRPKAALVVTCRACHRQVTLDVIALACTRGPDVRVRDMERGMRCDGCGQLGWAAIAVEWL